MYPRLNRELVTEYVHFLRSRMVFDNLPYHLDAAPGKLHHPMTFIIGASGSGTTMLSKILCSPRQVIGIDDFKDVPITDAAARAAADRFKIVTQVLWDRESSQAQYQRAKLAVFCSVEELFGQEAYTDARYLVHKRSAPFFRGERCRPDVSDLFDIFESPRIVVLYRDPCESTYSSLRRGFAGNLKQCAVICEDQLTYIDSQLATLDKASYKVITYEALCSRPLEIIPQLAEFTGLPLEELKQATIDQKVTVAKMGRWRQLLLPEDVSFLDSFFDARRRAQWPILSAAPR